MMCTVLLKMIMIAIHTENISETCSPQKFLLNCIRLMILNQYNRFIVGFCVIFSFSNLLCAVCTQNKCLKE